MRREAVGGRADTPQTFEVGSGYRQGAFVEWESVKVDEFFVREFLLEPVGLPDQARVRKPLEKRKGRGPPNAMLWKVQFARSPDQVVYCVSGQSGEHGNEHPPASHAPPACGVAVHAINAGRRRTGRDVLSGARQGLAAARLRYSDSPTRAASESVAFWSGRDMKACHSCQFCLPGVERAELDRARSQCGSNVQNVQAPAANHWSVVRGQCLGLLQQSSP